MSNIEWTNATWNPVVGCTPVSPGCLNCYAATMAPRLAAMGQAEYVGLTVERKSESKHKRHVFNGTVRTLEDRLDIPLGWKKPRMVFVNSMSDLFHEAVPFGFIRRVFDVMARCQRHAFQILTKRPERFAPFFGEFPAMKFLPNVWLGTSVERQAEADARVHHLRAAPAAVRFLSCEPLLGPLSLDLSDIHWVIVGGESGHHPREYNIAWAESIIGQCRKSGVPCFHKQVGAWPVDRGMERWPGEYKPRWCDRVYLKSKKGGDPSEWLERHRVREFPKAVAQ